MGYGMGGAHCAIHADQPAARTCTRCGNFMCSTCTQGGTQTLCPACQQRMGMGEGFPLTRDSWTFSALWDYCFEIFKREWLMLSVGVLIFLGMVMIVSFLSQVLVGIGAAMESPALIIVITVANTLVQMVVQNVFLVGLMRMLFDMLQGGKADIGRIFSQLHKAGTIILSTLLFLMLIIIAMAVIVGIGFALGSALGEEALPFVIGGLVVVAFVPLIYFLLPLYLLQAEIAYSEDVGPIQAIKNCYVLARGQRLSLFGVSMVAGLVAIAGVFACCVGVLPAVGLGYLLIGGLYLALRNGAEPEAEG
jgi:hypothetical protein